MNEMTIKLIFDSQLAYLPFLRKAIRGICSCLIQDEQSLHDIDLCLHEAISNVIYHSYRNEAGHEIQLIVKLGPEELEFQIIDVGLKNFQADMDTQKQIEFDPNDINSLPETGRRLFIIQQLMDKVSYTSFDKKNVLTLYKHVK
jgi:serine/threonine-protein kinase RsbW